MALRVAWLGGAPDAPWWIWIVIPTLAAGWAVATRMRLESWRSRRARKYLRLDRDDDRLIKRAADGDESAARELSARHDRRIARLRSEAQGSPRAAQAYFDHLGIAIGALRELPGAAHPSGLTMTQAQAGEVAAEIARLEGERRWAEEHGAHAPETG